MPTGHNPWQQIFTTTGSTEYTQPLEPLTWVDAGGVATAETISSAYENMYRRYGMQTGRSSSSNRRSPAMPTGQEVVYSEDTRISFQNVTYDVGDNTIRFQYRTAPRVANERGDGTIFRSTLSPWKLSSCNSPECGNGSSCLFVYGDRSQGDTNFMYTEPTHWNYIMYITAEWNCVKLGDRGKKGYFMCPDCGDIEEVVLEYADFISTNFIRTCEGCRTGVDNAVEIPFNVAHMYYLPDSNRWYVIGENSMHYIDAVRQLQPRRQKIREHCLRCGTKTDNWITNPNQPLITSCSNCADHFAICNICDRYEPILSMHKETNGSYVCRRHYKDVVCDICMTATRCRESEIDIEGDYHGYSGPVWHCDKCKTLNPADFYEKECSYSFKEQHIKAFHVNRGKKKPTVDVNSVKSLVPFMGMEIEMMMGQYSPVAQIANDNTITTSFWKPKVNRAIKDINYNLAKPFGEPISICKHDGTIPYGTEIVINPLSLSAWHHLYSSGYLQNIFKWCDIEATEPKTIGGHIHLNRSACSKKQIHQMVTFIHQNEEFMTLMAGRKVSKSSEWCKAKLANHPMYMIKAANYKSPDRYVAVNLTSGTLEHRYFTTPTSAEHAIRNIEFVYALWEATQYGYLKSWETLVEFVKARTKTYKVLAPWFTEKISSRKHFKTNDPTITNTDRTPPPARMAQPARPRNLASTIPSFILDDDDHVECDGETPCTSCGDTFDVRYCSDVDEYRCNDCGWVYCEDCGESVHEYNQVGDSYVCNSCIEGNAYMWCDNCDRYRYSDGSATVDAVRLCDSCIDRVTTYCDDCDTLRLSGNTCNCGDHAEEEACEHDDFEF